MSLNILHLFNKVSATQTALIKRIDAIENTKHVDVEPELPVHNGVKVTEDLQDSLHDAVQRIDFLENANRQLKQQISEFKDISNTIAAYRTTMNEAISSSSTEKNSQAKVNKEVIDMIQSALKKIDDVESRQKDVESRQKDKDVVIQKSLAKNEEEVSSIDDKLLSMELELEKGISKANEMKNSIAGNFNESIAKMQSDLSEGLSRLEDQIKETQYKTDHDARAREEHSAQSKAKQDEVEEKLKKLEKRMETNENEMKSKESKESKENNEVSKPSMNQRPINGLKPSPLDLTEGDLNDEAQAIENMLNQKEKSSEDLKLTRDVEVETKIDGSGSESGGNGGNGGNGSGGSGGNGSGPVHSSDGISQGVSQGMSQGVSQGVSNGSNDVSNDMSNDMSNDVSNDMSNRSNGRVKGSPNTSIDISNEMPSDVISKASKGSNKVSGETSTDAPSNPPVKRTRKKEMRKKW